MSDTLLILWYNNKQRTAVTTELIATFQQYKYKANGTTWYATPTGVTHV